MRLETMWNLGKLGKRKITRVRTMKYWKEEKMEEEEKMTGRLRTLPPGLEGKEEAIVTKIQEKKAVEDMVPKGRREKESRNIMVRRK